MAQKLTGVYEYLKSGDKLLKGYRVHLTKSLVEEKTGFDENTKVKITYKKGKIIIEEEK